MQNEMAHYAADCWDAELHTSYGWIECVGCADRSAYDLTVHSARTGQSLVVRQSLEVPREFEVIDPIIDRKKFGPFYKKDAKRIEEALMATTQCEREDFMTAEMTKLSLQDLGEVAISPEHVKWERVTKKENVREYTPNVIEPSFGLGRILYSVLEHSFWTRPEDRQRGVLSLPASVAPIKCLLVPLSSNAQFTPIIGDISTKLRKLGISSKVDDSNTQIGKRYARNDELGTPFGITVDFQTVQDKTITLRERDTTKQIRGDQDEVLVALKDLIEGYVTWDAVFNRFGEFTGQVVV